MVRRCPECQTDKPIEEFCGRRKCRECRLRYQKTWYQANRAHVAESDKSRKQAEPLEKKQARLDRQKRWYEQNRERILEQRRDKKLHESPLARDARVASKQVRSRAFYARHALDERQRSSEKRRTLRQQAMDAYGHKCACCGEERFEFLSVDHIEGGGRRHREEVGAGYNFYRWLKRNGFPKEGFRLLCHNCNQSMGAYGYCPHQLQQSSLQASK